LGSEIPKEQLIWQDPLPKAGYAQIDATDVAALKVKILVSALAVPELVRTAWASAVTFRYTDMRGGANGARIRLAPQKDWAVNDPADLSKVIARLETIQQDFNQNSGTKKVSLADLIVLGGSAAIEAAAKQAGVTARVPFTPGRVDATAAQIDAASFAMLEPKADSFRNYYGSGLSGSPAELLVERSNLLSLSVPEMTVLVGGMRALNANEGGSTNGVFTQPSGHTDE
jgi:catalase-peroxidase